MRAARVISCVVLLACWAAMGYAAASGPTARVAKPAKRAVIDNTQRIDVNNISMVVINIGSFAYDKAMGAVGLEFPKGIGKMVVFVVGLWIGGQVGGVIRLAVDEY